MVARKLVDFTHGWNAEIHNAIEAKVIAEYMELFPPTENDDREQRDKRIKEMRQFYYSRMSVTATLLVAVAAIFAALLICLIQAWLTSCSQ